MLGRFYQQLPFHNPYPPVFVYDKLPDATKTIRLVTIQPGAWDAPLVLTVRPRKFMTKVANVPTNLDHSEAVQEFEVPEYEALSYVWGSDVADRKVYIAPLGLTDLPVKYVHVRSGTELGSAPTFIREYSESYLKKRCAELLVTENLEDALRYLRHEHTARTMWIDAICINQFNTTEKSLHISIMGQIFKRAKRVVSWIGQADMLSEDAIDMLQALGDEVEMTWDINELRPAQNAIDPKLGHVMEVLPYSEKKHESFLSFVNREYFERMWIRQEVFLSSRDSYIQCGQRTISWNTARKALAALYLKPNNGFKSTIMKNFSERMNAIRHLVFMPAFIGLQTLRYDIGNVKCRDPRDRIYAILEILNEDEKQLNLTPNYEKTVQEVYMDTVMAYLGRYGGLDLICQCELPEDLDIPSWIPEFTTHHNAFDYLPLIASSKIAASYTVNQEEGILDSAGVYVSTIKEVRKFDIDPWNQPALERMNMFASILPDSWEDPRPEMPGKWPGLNEYALTFLGGDYTENYDPPREHEFSLATCKYVLNYLQSGRRPTEYDANETNLPWYQFLSKSRGKLHGRQFFRATTENDEYIGLAPAKAKKGDIVVVLFGAASPICLRPSAENDTYKVVGECFCPGVNYGEALLGSIPSHFSLVRIVDVNGADSWKFKNHETGKTQYEDPRLERLNLNLDQYREKLIKSRGSTVLRVAPSKFQDIGVTARQWKIT